MSRYFDDSTFATNAMGFVLDLGKLKFLMPEICNPLQILMYKFRKWGFQSNIEQVEEHLRLGDSQGAIVVKTKPLLIAAYNSDIDCVVMLKYEQKIQHKYNFKERDKLVCVNTFGDDTKLQSDLIPGERNSGMWTMVHPIIADLVSNSQQQIEIRKKDIGDDAYDYIWKLATAYLSEKKGVYRNGKPFFAALVKQSPKTHG